MSCRQHEHSVVETASTIQGCAKGTLEGVMIEELREKVAWLRWRITDGWDPAIYGDDNYSYDQAVRQLACEALDLVYLKEKDL